MWKPPRVVHFDSIRQSLCMEFIFTYMNAWNLCFPCRFQLYQSHGSSKGLYVVDLTSERPSFCFKPSGIIDRAIDKMLGDILFLGGGNSNMFYFQPYLGKTNPFWRAYFSNGLKPPTGFAFFRICSLYSIFTYIHNQPNVRNYNYYDDIQIIL